MGERESRGWSRAAQDAAQAESPPEEPLFESRVRSVPAGLLLLALPAALVATGLLVYLFGPLGLLMLVAIGGVFLWRRPG